MPVPVAMKTSGGVLQRETSEGAGVVDPVVRPQRSEARRKAALGDEAEEDVQFRVRGAAGDGVRAVFRGVRCMNHEFLAGVEGQVAAFEDEFIAGGGKAMQREDAGAAALGSCGHAWRRPV
jgi:hypothetical protein